MATLATGPDTSNHSITELLGQFSAGDREAEARLIEQIYGELKRLAARYMRGERGNHTLQPTALVNEAYVQLVRQPHVPWQSRAHFFACASHLMRHILVDHARRCGAEKRGGHRRQVSLVDAIHPIHERSIDVLALDEALERLAKLDPRQAQVVELHFFGGLTFEEIGLIVKLDPRTLKRDWNMAKAWLKVELSK